MNGQTYVEIALWGLITWGTLYFLYQMLPRAAIKGIKQAVFPVENRCEQPPKLVGETNGQ